ncbi:amidohydrolase family protein [Alicyclobacillus fodiniaquatilis]|uniref:Amidohydrolase family protein n=1 Tax=Alicyclobacillus fodiniaquatilis TaxID=1661150 RepID=A0ABW4JBG5_9BACL
MRIDAHQHYWRINRNDYGWITRDINVLYRDFFPRDLSPHLQSHGIDKTIVVQAAPTVEETEFLLHLSEQEETIVGVVGWFDLADPFHRKHFDRFSQYKKFVGFRVMIQDMEDPSLILRPNVIDALREYAKLNVPVDLLVKASQLPVLLKLLKAVPRMRGVVDHLAKPDIAHASLQPWKEHMAEIASYPQIYCKLSGMVTEAEREKWAPSDFTAYVLHIIEVFGAERVIYGSDWPVCLLAASYDDVWQLANSSLPETLLEPERANIFGYNAARFYKLPSNVL